MALKTMQDGIEDAREKKASTAHYALQMADKEIARLRSQLGGTDFWVVLDEKRKPIFMESNPMFCHQFIKETIGQIKAAQKWTVRRAVVVE